MGISRASLYYTFGDKKQLFEKAFSHYLVQNVKSSKQFFSQSEHIKTKFLMLFEQNVDQTVLDDRRKGCFAVNTATECTPEDLDFLALVESNNVSIISIFKKALKEAQENGEISQEKNIASIVHLLYTLLNGILVVGKVNPDKKTLMASVKTVLIVLD